MMRVAIYVLAVLVFAAALVLDTGALLALVGGTLWAHRLVPGGATVLVVVAAVGWRRLRPRAAPKPRGRAAATRRPKGPQQKRAASGRGPKRSAKQARAR